MKHFLYNLFLSLVAVFSPITPLILTVGFLIALDFFVGIYRAFKLKEPISSRKMGNTISKMLLYQCTILSLYVFEVYILDSALPITKIGAGLISIVEIKSLDENIQKITGISVYDRIVKVLKRGVSNTKDFI